MSRISMPFPTSGRVGLLPSGSANTYGAWTSMWTAPFALDGLVLNWQPLAANSLIQIGIGPSQYIILENWLSFNNGSNPITIPVKIPAGVEIYGQYAVNNTDTTTSYAVLEGIPSGSLPKESLGFRISSLGALISNTYFGVTYNASTIYQLTSSPLLIPAKRLWVIMANTPINFSVGLGPSTSLTDTLIQNLIGAQGTGNGYIQEVPIFAPAGNNLFADMTDANFGSFYILN